MAEQEEKSEHLRRLLAIVDSTLSQFSLPPITKDDSQKLSEIDCGGCLESSIMNEPLNNEENIISQRGKRNDVAEAAETFCDDLISLDLSKPFRTQTSWEAPKRCLICDDVEWDSPGSPAKTVSADNPQQENQEAR